MGNDELIAKILASARTRTRKVPVCSRGDLVAEHEEIVERLQAAILRSKSDRSLAGDPEVQSLQDQLVKVEAEMEAETFDVVVSALSHRAWADLVAAFPPTDEQASKGSDVDDLAFQVASVAACTGIPVEQATVLEGTLPAGEWGKLYVAVLALNVKPTSAPKLAAATAVLAANGTSSTTADPEGSPEASS